jgi:hypothetical protein
MGKSNKRGSAAKTKKQPLHIVQQQPHQRQAGGEISNLSKLDYGSIKLSKKMNMKLADLPEPPPTDCSIL